ncbi:hypothetical protein AK812_SmicGene12941 [Symbiodinium microadriaticum]|uniref:Uncharacterized protein n=1 Tax=Symbiodinium microadriaticum TaxID=2951 RepID=A0A1Q9E9E2_SYMMI|nr:hypothetical protein AK812_SmicGene12941 [Symbiodinium microadriaticum]
MTAKTVAVAPQNVQPIPEERVAATVGNELAEILPQLSARTVEEIKNEGVQTTVIAMHLMRQIPADPPDLRRLAIGESFVRPTVNVDPQPVENASASGPAQIDATHGEAARAAAKATVAPTVSKSLMKEGNGASSPDQPAWFGESPKWTVVWTLDIESLVTEANDFVDILLNVPQIGLAEAVYRREWGEDAAPLLSLRIPGREVCRFEHPDEDENANGPMSSLRMPMSSPGIAPAQNDPIAKWWRLPDAPHEAELAQPMEIKAVQWANQNVYQPGETAANGQNGNTCMDADAAGRRSRLPIASLGILPGQCSRLFLFEWFWIVSRCCRVMVKFFNAPRLRTGADGLTCFRCRPVLILEDDAVPAKQFCKRLKRVVLVRPGGSDWLLVYTKQSTFGRLKSSLGRTVAYVLWPKGAQKLLSVLPVDQPVDNFMAWQMSQRQFFALAVYPQMVKQELGWDRGSDVPHSDDAVLEKPVDGYGGHDTRHASVLHENSPSSMLHCDG